MISSLLSLLHPRKASIATRKRILRFFADASGHARSACLHLTATGRRQRLGALALPSFILAAPGQMTLASARDGHARLIFAGLEQWAAVGLVVLTAWLLLLAIGLPSRVRRGASESARRPTGPTPGVQPSKNGDSREAAAGSTLGVQRIEIEAHRERLAMVGKLTAQVVHALSSPLTGITAIVDELLEECGSDERKSLELVRNEAERASAIVREILHFARRETSRPVVSLNEIVEGALSLFDLGERSNRLKLTRELTEEPTLLRAAPSQLQQAILNLLDNARHAVNGRGGGEIKIRTIADGERVRIEVSDNGPGIPLEIRDRIFEPFFTTKAPGVGTGLGLAIVASVVRESGGEISLDSAPGSGTRFTISLPRCWSS